MSAGFLERWSRRKLASAARAVLADPAVPAVPAAAPRSQGGGQAGAPPAAAGSTPAAGSGAGAVAPAGAEAQLPPVEELTLASDFTAFLKDEVSEALRRQALHKLFADPHFNRMDGLDIYIDDYSQPDPIPPEAMAKLKHAREWLMANQAEVDAAKAVNAGAPAGQVDAEGVGSESAPEESGPEASGQDENGLVRGASTEVVDDLGAGSDGGPRGAAVGAGDDAARAVIPSAAYDKTNSGQKAP
jgi:hypothetical protein